MKRYKNVIMIKELLQKIADKEIIELYSFFYLTFFKKLVRPSSQTNKYQLTQES